MARTAGALVEGKVTTVHYVPGTVHSALVKGKVTTVHYVPGTVHSALHCTMFSAIMQCLVCSVQCSV